MNNFEKPCKFQLLSNLKMELLLNIPKNVRFSCKLFLMAKKAIEENVVIEV